MWLWDVYNCVVFTSVRVNMCDVKDIWTYVTYTCIACIDDVHTWHCVFMKCVEMWECGRMGHKEELAHGHFRSTDTKPGTSLTDKWVIRLRIPWRHSDLSTAISLTHTVVCNTHTVVWCYDRCWQIQIRACGDYVCYTLQYMPRTLVLLSQHKDTQDTHLAHRTTCRFASI